MTDKFRVETFGRDCLGNISGFCVVRGYGWNREIAGQFCGDIYEQGSFDVARINADELCADLNGEFVYDESAMFPFGGTKD